MSKIIKTSFEILSPWVTLVTRSIDKERDGIQDFHSLAQADYVSILAITADGNIPLVRQFRPATQSFTLELPGGLIDVPEQPEAVAIRELAEETGFYPTNRPVLLGRLLPDTGRLENKLWGYFMNVSPMDSWEPEALVEPILLTKKQLKSAIEDGSFNHALHIAIVGLSIIQGQFSFE